MPGTRQPSVRKLTCRKATISGATTPGRSFGRDPVRTRARILAAAEREFSTRGYAGAKLEAIARRAKVTKGLVFHYFRSKQALFTAVMEQIYQQLRQRQNETALAGLAPEAGIRRLAIDTFRSFREAPEIVAMMNEENLHRAHHIAGSAIIPALYNPLINEITRLLAEGEATGIFRTGVDPVAFYIALSGLGYFYCSNRYTLGTVFRCDLFEPGRVAVYETQIADMAVAYLAARP